VTKQSLQQNEQSEKINKSIDKALNQILGPTATQIIYDYLEIKHSIQRHEIAAKLDSFSYALREYLGTGAFVIEKVIFENLEQCRLEETKLPNLQNDRILNHP